MCRRLRVRSAVKTTGRSKQKRFPLEIGEGRLQRLSNLMGKERCWLEVTGYLYKGEEIGKKR